jgi:pimeloyl-ACP methyl ester carboxylesterase
MAIASVNGCDFYCELSGAGPDLVFIHGEIHGLEFWEHQIPEFSRDHRCLAYNRRGHARTAISEYGFSLVNQTRDLACLLDHFAMERPTIIAVAFGTTIAVNFAIQHPERVKGLILVAWSELHEAMLYFERWKKYSELVTRILETEGRERLLSYLREEAGKSIYRVIPVDSPIRDKCIRMFASHPVEEYRRGMLEFALSVPDLIPQFRTLQLPVLGVCGEKDPYPDHPEVLAGMSNFKEAVPIASAGRFVHWEQPEAFNRLVRQFLSRDDDNGSPPPVHKEPT